jgi:TolB-like protein/Flp pilus assembly protein TadD
MSRLRQFIREIHRRSLWQVLGIYLFGAWAAYQVILSLTEGGILPDWFPGVAVGLFIVGLPIVLATAFIQEGVGGDDGRGSPRAERAGDPDERRPAPDDRAAATTHQPLASLLTWRKSIAAGVFAFVFAGLIAATASFLGAPAAEEGPAGERTIAVLPLENMSPDPEDAFFTDGIHEEIITRLYRIGDIRTLARASVVAFDAADRSLDEVARTLGVNYLLVGSVRRADDRSRVSVALIEPRSGEQLWANTYEARGTDVFAVQASIAENVASALRTELSPAAKERMTALPTTSAEAYDDYLRGNDALRRSYGRTHTEQAIAFLQAAVEEDPAFAVAHSRLAEAHLQHYWFHYDHSEERLAIARDHIDRALALDGSLPEAHFAMARYHYWGRLAYEEALRELDVAESQLPSDPEIPLVRASVHRRAGDFDAAVASFLRSTELDPRYWATWWNLAETYMLLRRYEEALATADRAAETGLGVSDAWTLKADIRLQGLARPEAALATLDSVPTDMALGEYRPSWIRVRAHVLLGQYDRALAAVDSTWVTNQFLVRPPALLRGLVYRLSGDPAAARAAFDSARVELERASAGAPEDVRLMGAHALALAGLGRGDEAIALAERAARLLPPEREAWRGTARLEDLALVQVMAGREAEAVRTLEQILARPFSLSRAAVARDPVWAPLRDRDDFRRLVGSDG